MAKSDTGPRPKQSGQSADRPLDRDEKVKIDLPFEAALRALLDTPPESETATPDGKRR